MIFDENSAVQVNLAILFINITLNTSICKVTIFKVFKYILILLFVKYLRCIFSGHYITSFLNFLSFFFLLRNAENRED